MCYDIFNHMKIVLFVFALTMNHIPLFYTLTLRLCIRSFMKPIWSRICHVPSRSWPGVNHNTTLLTAFLHNKQYYLHHLTCLSIYTWDKTFFLTQISRLRHSARSYNTYQILKRPRCCFLSIQLHHDSCTWADFSLLSLAKKATKPFTQI